MKENNKIGQQSNERLFPEDLSVYVKHILHWPTLSGANLAKAYTGVKLEYRNSIS
jgi:hypothetical protein